MKDQKGKYWENFNLLTSGIHYKVMHTRGRNKDWKSEISEKVCCPSDRKISKTSGLKAFCFPELKKFSYYVSPFLD